MAGRRKKNRFEFLTRKFPIRMQRKLILLFMLVIVLFVALILRITYINLTSGSRYTKIVLDQQNYGNRVIPYKRGDIVDRNGTKLATSERVYNVILDVVVMTDQEKYVDPTIEVLMDCFDIEEQTVRDAIEENPESRYVILKKDVDYKTAQKFEEIDNDNENYPNVQGVWLEEDYIRTYPYNTLASDVIGFTYSGNAGAIGIESAYNDILNGTDGREYGYFDSDATIERTVKAAKNGNTVVSTIDVTLQSIVEKCIQDFNEEHAGEQRENEPGSLNTAVIIMDPNTGEILAEASYPNFDLNNPREISTIYWEENQQEKSKLYSEEEWNKLSEEEQLDSLSILWRNFCVSNAFEPGSPMKPFVVAAGLETGALKGDETYYCDGSLHVGDYDIGCHLRSGHGTETIQDAIANSCNVALMKIGEAIGAEDFVRYQHIFGFGEYTGIDLPGEANTSSLLFSAEDMTSVDLATNSFGQSFNVTMTQLAAGFCSLINGGYYYEPHVVKQIQDEDGNVIETKDPVLLRKTISAETSEQMREYMMATMDYGTGQRAQVEGYSIGAKTGTAEKLPRGNNEYLLSYVGFAPADDPEVLIYVVIDEPNVGAQDDSSLVLELSKNIMEEAFPYLGVTTIEEAEAAQKEAEEQAKEEGTNFGDTEYSDYDENYEDTYDKPDGGYEDENYDPDLDDWAEGNNNNTE